MVMLWKHLYHTYTHWRHNYIRSHICSRLVLSEAKGISWSKSLCGMWYENTKNHTHIEGIIIADLAYALDQYLPEARGIYWSKVYMGCGMKTPLSHTHSEGIIKSDLTSILDQYLSEAKGIYWSEVYMGCGTKNLCIAHTDTHTQCN